MPEPLGPSEGDIQNTAPSVVLNAAVSVQSHKPRLGEVVIALGAEPSVIPTVSHESNSASAMTAEIAGLTPPISAPTGEATWYAGGIARSPRGVPANA